MRVQTNHNLNPSRIFLSLHWAEWGPWTNFQIGMCYEVVQVGQRFANCDCAMRKVQLEMDL